MGTISDVVSAAKKEYKSDALIKMGGDPLGIPRLPTGMFAMDLALGGGIPRGCVTILYGDESSAKTTTCLKAIVTAQRREPKKRAVFVDIEGHLNLQWAKRLGVNIKELVVVRPNYAEQAVDLIEKLMYAEDCSIVVVDSLAAMITTKEAEKSAEDVIVGGTGLVINKLYRRVTLARNKVMKEDREPPTLILINQIRYKIGMLFGNPETMPGGPAFKFCAFLIVRLHGEDKVDKTEKDGTPIKQVFFKKITGQVKKDKIGCISKSFEFEMCVSPISEDGWAIGDTDEWSTWSAYAKVHGLMAKKASGKGWNLFSFSKNGDMLEFPSEEACREYFLNTPEYRDLALLGLISHVAAKKAEMEDE